MKLIEHTAIVPGPISAIASSSEELAARAMAPLPGGVIGLLGLAVAVPILAPAFATFHETAFHRLAVSDYSFHPVHTSYVYG